MIFSKLNHLRVGKNKVMHKERCSPFLLCELGVSQSYESSHINQQLPQCGDKTFNTINNLFFIEIFPIFIDIHQLHYELKISIVR